MAKEDKKAVKKITAINYPKKDEKGDAKKVRKEMRDLDFHFTDSEMQKMGIQLAITHRELGEINAEKKVELDSFKMRIDAKQTIIDTLSKELEDGYATRNLSCEVKLNFETGMREYWHSGSMRDSEPLRAEDHQTDIFEEDHLKDNKKINKVFDIRLIAGDMAVTKQGTVIEITADDELNGINYELIERLATNEEIEKFNNSKSKK